MDVGIGGREAGLNAQPAEQARAFDTACVQLVAQTARQISPGQLNRPAVSGPLRLSDLCRAGDTAVTGVREQLGKAIACRPHIRAG